MMEKIPHETKENVSRWFLPFNLYKPDQPVIYAMAGVPGSGKTTFVESQLARGAFPLNGFIQSADAVMESLPQYIEDFNLIGPERAFEKWEMPARNLCYDLYTEAVEMRVHIIKDMGNCRMEDYEMLRELVECEGYHLYMYWLEIEPEEAIKRTKNRQRHTPEQMIWDRDKMLKRLRPLFENLATQFKVYSSMEGGFLLRNELGKTDSQGNQPSEEAIPLKPVALQDESISII